MNNVVRHTPTPFSRWRVVASLLTAAVLALALALTTPSRVQADRPVGAAVTQTVAGATELVTITPAAIATGGTFTLTFGGQTTGAIAFNASTTAIDTALTAAWTTGIPAGGDVIVGGTIFSAGTAGLTLEFNFGADVGAVTLNSSLTQTVAVTAGVAQTTAGVAEVQTLTPNGSSSAGTFTVTFDGATTGALAHNITAGDLDTAIEALSSTLIADSVAVAGAGFNTGGAFTITFKYGGDVPQITATPTGMTGVTTLTGATSTPGVAEIQTLTPSLTATGGTYTITLDSQTTSALAFNADTTAINTALEALSSTTIADSVVPSGTLFSAGTGGLTLQFFHITDATAVTVASSLTNNAAAGGATPGVTRNGAGAVRLLKPTDVAIGGSFTITVNGQTTAGALPFDASAATVDAALEALSSIPIDNGVTVSGQPFSASSAGFTLTFAFGGNAVVVSMSSALIGAGPPDVDEPPTAAPAPTLAPAPDVPGVALGNVQTGTASETQTTMVSTTSSSGATAQVQVPPSALPAGATVQVAAVADIAALVSAAPPPLGATVIGGFQISARTTAGAAVTGNFDAPVSIILTIPASALPSGTSASNVALAFWNGSGWVVTAATITLNTDGSLSVNATVGHFTLFSILKQPAPSKSLVFSGGTIAASGVSIVSFTGTTAQLDAVGAANTPLIVTVSATVGGKLITFVIGAPAFVNADFNAAFPTGLNATLVIVKTGA